MKAIHTFFLRSYPSLVMIVHLFHFKCPKKRFVTEVGLFGTPLSWPCLGGAFYSFIRPQITHMPNITQLDTPIKCFAADLVRREAPHWASLQGFYCAEGRDLFFGVGWLAGGSYHGQIYIYIYNVYAFMFISTYVYTCIYIYTNKLKPTTSLPFGNLT